MKRVIWILASWLLLSGCNWSIGKSGIEIMSYPPAKVYIDNKEAGMTPYKNNSLSPGEIEVKLVVGEREWGKKIRLENGANTVINREFGINGKEGGGFLLSFENTGNKNKAGILISSNPDRAALLLDETMVGMTPLRVENVGEGDKKMVISYPGHKSINTFVKFINGFQLVVEADLPAEESEISPTPGVPIPTLARGVTEVVIKTTETGWLRVRDLADANGKEVARVIPGEKYILRNEKDGWYQIELSGGTVGWISTKYAEKVGGRVQ